MELLPAVDLPSFAVLVNVQQDGLFFPAAVV
jgi:hypothetical protein